MLTSVAATVAVSVTILSLCYVKPDRSAEVQGPPDVMSQRCLNEAAKGL